MSNILKTQLLEDMKSALRAHETIKLGAVRFLMAEIKNYEIDNGEQDDEGIQRLVAGEIKKMRDGVAEFKAAGRDDLIPDEEAKIEVLSAYLPQQLTDEELEKIVAEVVAEMGDAAQANPGQVIGAVMKKVTGKADGGRVKSVVMKIVVTE